MSIGTHDKSSESPLLFPTLWMLSVAVPAVLLMVAVEIADEFTRSILSRLFLLFLIWLVIGYLQSRLLVRHLRRHRLWVILTWVGGGLGMIGALSADVWLRGLTETPPALAAAWSEAMFAGIAGAAAGGFLGLLQSICLDGYLSGRLLWFAGSALGGFLATAAGVLSGAVVSWLVSDMTLDSYDSYRSLALAASWRPYAIVASGTAVFGMPTGIFMRRLLLWRARQRVQGLVGQFD